jgi:beta-ureidopropionase
MIGKLFSWVRSLFGGAPEPSPDGAAAATTAEPQVPQEAVAQPDALDLAPTDDEIEDAIEKITSPGTIAIEVSTLFAEEQPISVIQTEDRGPDSAQPDWSKLSAHQQVVQEKPRMSRIVKAGLIQTTLAAATSEPIEKIRDAQIERTLKYVDQAGQEGVQILCLQEIFTGPYFCAEQSPRWFDAVERIPDGPTTKLMQEYARKYKMVIVVPLYEEESTGIYYNTAAVIDADGKYLGKYRKNHIPHTAPGFWEKFYFRPGNLGYPVFDTQYAKVGVYICYDRHFPEGARELGLNGAEIVLNPSATVAGLSEYLWKLEQPAHAVANGYFVGAINRVGFEGPWNIGEFYGQSYFCDPRGQIVSIAARDKDALVTAELDFEKIREVRHTWQFYRDRRPDTYKGIAAP